MLQDRFKKSKPAHVLLTIFGCSLLFIGATVILTGCFLTLHESFQGLPRLKKKINIDFDYSHYWNGGTYLITAAFTLSSGSRQTKRRLTFTTAMFLVLSMIISLFAIVLDGPDWVEWKNTERTIRFWESKDGYSCRSKNDTCSCGPDNGADPQLVSSLSDCDKVVMLTAMYGIIVSGAIVGLVICLAALLVMINSISWKNPWKAYTSYSTSFENSGAFSTLDDVMDMYKESQRCRTVVLNSTTSMARQNKQYMPAWSLYGTTTEDYDNNPGPS